MSTKVALRSTVASVAPFKGGATATLRVLRGKGRSSCYDLLHECYALRESWLLEAMTRSALDLLAAKRTNPHGIRYTPHAG
jgi:hypothetical protein